MSQVRYQGVDWRNPENRGCNKERNPYGEHSVDGASLEVMEVLFVKVNQHMLNLGWSYPITAQKYDQWYQARAEVRSPASALSVRN